MSMHFAGIIVSDLSRHNFASYGKRPPSSPVSDLSRHNFTLYSKKSPSSALICPPDVFLRYSAGAYNIFKIILTNFYLNTAKNIFIIYGIRNFAQRALNAFR